MNLNRSRRGRWILPTRTNSRGKRRRERERLEKSKVERDGRPGRGKGERKNASEGRDTGKGKKLRRIKTEKNGESCDNPLESLYVHLRPCLSHTLLQQLQSRPRVDSASVLLLPRTHHCYSCTNVVVRSSSLHDWIYAYKGVLKWFAATTIYMKKDLKFWTCTRLKDARCEVSYSR